MYRRTAGSRVVLHGRVGRRRQGVKLWYRRGGGCRWRKLFEHALAKALAIARWPLNSLREIKRSLRLHHLPAIDLAIRAEQAGMARAAPGRMPRRISPRR